MAPEYRIIRPRDRCSRASHQHTGDRRRGLQMRSLPSVVDTPSSRGGHNDNNNTSRAASSQRSGRGSQASTSVTLASSPGSLNAANSRSGSTVVSTIEDDNEMGSDDREDLPDMPASNDGQNSRATDTDRDGSLIRRRCFHRLIGDNSDMTIAGDGAHIVFDNYTFNKYTFDDCIFDEHTFEEYTLLIAALSTTAV